MFGYICFCQIFVTATRDNFTYLETILVQLGTYRLFKIFHSLEFWNFPTLL